MHRLFSRSNAKSAATRPAATTTQPNNNNNNTPMTTDNHHQQHNQNNQLPLPRKATDGSQGTAATAPLSPLRARSASLEMTENSNGNDQQQQQQDHSQQQQIHSTSTNNRRRLNSRDIPRTYSGLYGNVNDDLLPFEMNRHRGTLTSKTVWIILGLYLTVLAIVQMASFLIVPTRITNSHPNVSWTLTNVIHVFVSTIYIHWLKGSIYDDSGEMDALTLWEQLEATQDTRPVREALMVIPCILTWVACHFADYDKQVCFINLLCWVISMLAKLPFMNGVRLFGINRTAGIDDLDTATTKNTKNNKYNNNNHNAMTVLIDPDDDDEDDDDNRIDDDDYAPYNHSDGADHMTDNNNNSNNSLSFNNNHKNKKVQ
eukprot:CAMPEP_0198140394 /NCGR_PEP_ID=MMETSP1443-20131203/3550_1 /TAXON_ID=186043 /ORGANISM="Entomoneis sp., Strain CCMP2396" /LENGTH=371 /DNA_ID=CAMNT_0043802789 /DNA_START=464 /DNA_END=1579 /DNA_ORIENTATION=-